jgi:hypothetical protein
MSVSTSRGSSENKSEGFALNSSGYFYPIGSVSSASYNKNYDSFCIENFTINNSGIQDPLVIHESVILKVRDEILRIVKRDSFTPGELSKTQLFFEKSIKNNKLLFEKAFQKAWLSLLAQNKTDHLYTFISMSSTLPYEELKDVLQPLVLAGTGHASPMINEAALRAIECWGDTSFVRCIEEIRPFSVEWLEAYRKQVVIDLKG